MKNNQIYNMTLTAVFASVIMLMALIPQIGFVTILPGVSVTLVHIPVLIGIFLLPRNYAILLGLFFGLGSWIASFMYASSAFDLAFQYPWISVLPRILFAAAAFYIYKGLFLLESKVKNGNTWIFGVVTLVTVIAIFFGSQAIVRSVSYADYNTEYYTKLYYEGILDANELDGETLTLAQIDEYQGYVNDIDANLPVLLDEAVDKENSISDIVTPLSLVVSVIFLTLYYHFISKRNRKEILYPSTFVLGTLSHTVLVLSTVALFSPKVFTATFGDSQSVISIVYAIAAANGLIEALVAVLIGTPIILALTQLQKNR